MHTRVCASPELRCVICRAAFLFEAKDVALVLRHVAYGYDFVHEGACLTKATDLMFPEPGYDCAAFGLDPERRRVLSVAPADGWTAILPANSGGRVRGEPLLCWALVQHRDGTATMEGVIRDAEWLAEPGGAEFAASGRRTRVVFEYARQPAGPHQPDLSVFTDDAQIQSAAA